MEVVVNGRIHELPEGATVAALLDSLQFDRRHVAVEVNLALVPRGEHGGQALHHGDAVEIVTLVGGG